MKLHNPILIILLIVFSCTQKQEEKQSQPKPVMESMKSPTGSNASLPHLVVGGDGKLYMSWVERRDSVWVDLKYATLDGENWSQPELIASGDDWFVNWADYPMISVAENGDMIAHFLAKSSSGTYSYDVNIVRKPAGGNWSEPIVIHDDGTPTEHGFISMLSSDGAFMVAWLDGRNTGGHGHGDHGGGAMTIRTASMKIDGSIADEYELDGRVCDCCQTGAAMTASGPVVVYRDRSELEIRDMSIVRKVNGKWTAPETIYADNWNIAGCPVNGPRVDALENNLAVAWYSAPGNKPQVKLIFSEDGGASFGYPIMIDDSEPLGRVDVEFLSENSAIISWLDTETDRTVIKAQQVSKDGSKGEVFVISETSESRGSGFPQMVKMDNRVYFAWTLPTQDGSTSIKFTSLTL